MFDATSSSRVASVETGQTGSGSVTTGPVKTASDKTRSARAGSRALTTAVLLCMAGSGLAALPAASAAAATTSSVSEKVLVLDDGDSMVGAVTDRLNKEGVPNQVISLTAANRPQITAAMLASTDASGTHGNYSGIVLPTDAPTQLSATELSTLNSYEAAFGVREVSAYDWANPTVGLNYAANPGYTGSVDGMTATVTTAGRTGSFGYLRGTLKLDDLSPTVTESYGYLATPLTTDPQGGKFTPLVTAPIPGTTTPGSLIGQYTQGGRDRLIITFASNSNQEHWKLLSHGIVNWLTRGISTSFNRNYLAVHVDDVLLADAVWSIPGKCTIGDGCDPTQYPDTAPGATARMQPADVTRLLTWQKANGLKLDLAFNGDGQRQYLEDNDGATSDPLYTALKTNASQIQFINHTWDHPFMGCEQTSNTPPWTCLTDAAGNTLWYPQASVESEIKQNMDFGATSGFPMTYNELVSGEHSGLATLPQQPQDNPNFLAALTTQGIAWVASDASRETTARAAGTATTVPRFPMNIFYNVSTKAQETAEYNYIYTSTADGGSGLCTANPTTSTCITPLDPNTGFDTYIAPLESQIMFGHMTDNNARPHYAHQTNLTDDGVLYPVLTSALNEYKATFAPTAPIVNPSMTQSGQTLVKQQNWATAQSGVTTTITGNQVVVKNTSNKAVQVPLTMPNGTTVSGAAFGAAYGGERSAWTQLNAGATLTLTLPKASGYTAPTQWPAAPAPAATAAMPANVPSTKTVKIQSANSAVINKVASGSH